MKNKFFSMLTGFVALAFAASAQTHTPVVTERQKIQDHRIKEGVKSGELTKSETKDLRADEKSIQATKQADKADGKVTVAERKQLRHEENATSRQIYRDKHNARVKH